MTLTQRLVTIALCALATMLTRFLPFLLFSSRHPTPKYVRYLGRALPPATPATKLPVRPRSPP